MSSSLHSPCPPPTSLLARRPVHYACDDVELRILEGVCKGLGGELDHVLSRADLGIEFPDVEASCSATRA